MTLKEKWPNIYNELLEVKNKLENQFKEVCDFEFTIENGNLYILQARVAKRTPRANLKFAIDFFIEGKIDLNEAISRIRFVDILDILEPKILNLSELKLIGEGLPANKGIATGSIVFYKSSLNKFFINKFPIISVLKEFSGKHIGLVQQSEGILTLRGGMSSHAAVNSRGMGKPCVVGCDALTIRGNYLEVGDSTLLKVGDFITINGFNGKVYKGKANFINTDWRNKEELVFVSKMIEFAIRSNSISNTNIGHCWAIRDFFLHSVLIKTKNTYKRPNLSSNKYISFSQPKNETIISYWSNIYIITHDDKENYKYILQGLRKTLLRVLSNNVGIGNHYKYFRPLFDPILAIRKKIQRQLIGEEYFNINRYVPYLIDVYNIKIFLEIKFDSDKDFWFLDTTNIKGESIVDNGDNFTGYKIFVNDALVTYKDLPIFYNSFRKREYYWRWFQYNCTDYKEIMTFIKKNKKERLANFRLNTYAHELGLLNNNELTISGMSLIGSIVKG